MVAIAPLAIFLGVAGTAVLFFYTLWGRINTRTTKKLSQFSELLDRAGISAPPEQIVLTLLGTTAILWIAIAMLARPPILAGLLFLPLCAGASVAGFYAIVQAKMRKRLDRFVQQLELALRLMSSGVRIGLGLRQALAIVIDEMPDQARHEYMRVVGKTNIGVSLYDAIDDLAVRMPSNETLMMSRVIRIQSQTGGDLSKILEQLANTIKERRRIARKISAMTAEGRASAGILAGLPLFLALFISLTEHDMGHALLFTTPGHIALLLVAVLDGCGVFWLLKMIKVEV